MTSSDGTIRKCISRCVGHPWYSTRFSWCEIQFYVQFHFWIQDFLPYWPWTGYCYSRISPGAKHHYMSSVLCITVLLGLLYSGPHLRQSWRGGPKVLTMNPKSGTRNCAFAYSRLTLVSSGVVIDTPKPFLLQTSPLILRIFCLMQFLSYVIHTTITFSGLS